MEAARAAVYETSLDAIVITTNFKLKLLLPSVGRQARSFIPRGELRGLSGSTIKEGCPTSGVLLKLVWKCRALPEGEKRAGRLPDMAKRSTIFDCGL